MRLDLRDLVDQNLQFLRHDQYDPRVGVAVSGGGDSMALLALAHDWARHSSFEIHAATVDHQLRPTAQAEIDLVSKFCESKGIPHSVLTWDAWNGQGNVQAAARNARYELLTRWMEDQELACVLLGHTADDQAETVLMNLSRGSGVDGLSGIAPSGLDGFERPLLTAWRTDLRAYLKEHDITWTEDPSNDDDRFTRVKARKMMALLGDLGLTPERLVQTADHMKRAKFALKRGAAEWARDHVEQQWGDLLMPRQFFVDIQGDTQGRIISGALMWLSGLEYRPRYTSLLDMAAALSEGEGRTLMGVVLKPEGDRIRLSREVASVGPPRGLDLTGLAERGGAVWDARWLISYEPPVRKGLTCPKRSPDFSRLSIKALGERLKDVPDWRKIGLPRASLMASPAVFEGEALISAPIAGLHNGFSARIVADYMSFLLSR